MSRNGASSSSPLIAKQGKLPSEPAIQKDERDLAAIAIQKHVRRFLATTSLYRHKNAIVTIQRFFRGFVGRRRASLMSSYSSYAHSQSSMRRSLQLMVKDHINQIVAPTRALESSLLHSWFISTMELEAAMRVTHFSSEKLESEWFHWKQKHYRDAISRGLPKGWVPRALGNLEGRVYYIHVRSGKAQLVHPNIMEEAQLASEKREQLEEKMEKEILTVREHAHAIRQVVSQEHNIIHNTFQKWRFSAT